MASPPPPHLWQIARVSHALAHPSRLSILVLLSQRGRLPLPAIEDGTGLSNPTVRQHLNALQRAGLVERSGPPNDWRAPRRGRRPHTFLLAGPALTEVRGMLDAFLGDVGEGGPVRGET